MNRPPRSYPLVPPTRGIASLSSQHQTRLDHIITGLSNLYIAELDKIKCNKPKCSDNIDNEPFLLGLTDDTLRRHILLAILYVYQDEIEAQENHSNVDVLKFTTSGEIDEEEWKSVVSLIGLVVRHRPLPYTSVISSAERKELTRLREWYASTKQIFSEFDNEEKSHGVEILNNTDEEGDDDPDYHKQIKAAILARRKSLVRCGIDEVKDLRNLVLDNWDYSNTETIKGLGWFDADGQRIIKAGSNDEDDQVGPDDVERFLNYELCIVYHDGQDEDKLYIVDATALGEGFLLARRRLKFNADLNTRWDVSEYTCEMVMIAAATGEIPGTDDMTRLVDTDEEAENDDTGKTKKKREKAPKKKRGREENPKKKAKKAQVRGMLPPVTPC